MNAMIDTLSPNAAVDGNSGDLASALDALLPRDREQKLATFRKHYASIEAALMRGVTHSGIRAALKSGGLSLSAATFRKMLDAERQRRKSEGNSSDGQEGGVQ